MNADFQSFDPASSLAAGLPRSTLRARGQGYGERPSCRAPQRLPRRGRAELLPHTQPPPAQEERLPAKEPRRSPRVAKAISSELSYIEIRQLSLQITLTLLSQASKCSKSQASNP